MLVAADLLKPSHPLHKALVAFCQNKNTPVSRRQAVRFLDKYPQYKEAKVA